MWKSRFRFLIFMVFVITLCTACQSEPAIETTHNDLEIAYEEVYMRIVEPYGSGFVLQGNVLRTVVGEHTYEFESTISETSRAMFVSNQEQLCIFLNKNGVSTAGLTFRILADYPNRTESENQTAYYGIDCVKSWEQVLTTIQACMGDYTNYGYLYALSNRIATDLLWTCDNIPSEKDEMLLDEPILLNLVYPCFSEKHSDAESIVVCKSLSIELLSTAEDIWSEAEFLKTREIYAQNKGIDFEPTYMTFAYNGESCPLKLSSQYLEIFWDYTFVANNEHLDGLIPVDYTDGVGGLIHTFEWLDVQLAMLCEQLGAVPKQQIPVQMMASLPRGYISPYIETGGLYYNEAGQGKIWATTVTALAHEYVHHIYWLSCGENDPNYEQWHNEAVAHYYTVGQRFEYRLNVINNVDPSYRNRLEAKLGEAYDEHFDYIKFLRIEWRVNEREYIYYLKDNNDLSCTFGEFFVRTYGEDVFLNSMMYPSKVKEFTGVSMDDIIEAWIADMRNPENDQSVIVVLKSS